MPPPRTEHSDEWKIAEFDRRTVESLDLLRVKVERLELWQAGIQAKVAVFATIFGVGGTIATELILHFLKLK